MPDPIQSDLRGTMNALARGIDDIFNGEERPKRVAFCLLTANFGDTQDGRVNYISNAERADMISMVKEWLARVEGRYIDQGGTA